MASEIIMSGRAASMTPSPGVRKVRQMKRKFTVLEDNLIRELVRYHGEKAWKMIAAALTGRSARQCRERWRYYLAPNIQNPEWTVDEDRKLELLAGKHGHQWAKIAGLFERRTDVNVKNRWVLLQRNAQKFPESTPSSEDAVQSAVSWNEGEERRDDEMLEFWGSDEDWGAGRRV